LSNAIKFTSKDGRVSLLASSVDDPIDHSTQRVQIVVSDTGCGIPEADLPFVFDPYRQAASNNQNKGVGLGLAIVKRIIDGHGGTIAVDSKVGRGTTFTIELKTAP
jgi:signal transduction histidine kinase